MEEIPRQGDSPTTSSTSSEESRLPYIKDLEDLMSRVAADDPNFDRVSRKFLEGLGPISCNIDILMVHKNKFLNPIQDPECFNDLFGKLRNKRIGECECRLEVAYLGGTKEEVMAIVNYGFHGNGSIILSRNSYSCDSLLHSHSFDQGVQHVLVCDVLIGRVMAITGTIASHYEGKKIDTCPPNADTDTLMGTREIMVYDCYKNSFVLPRFVITFRSRLVDRLKSLRFSHLYTRNYRRLPSMILRVVIEFMVTLSPDNKTQLQDLMRKFEDKQLSFNQVVNNLRLVQQYQLVRRVYHCYFSVMVQRCTMFSTRYQDELLAISTLDS